MEKLIVAVEDEDHISVLLRMTLEGTPGIRLLTAATGPEGLALCQAELPDLVLLDVRLPVMNGFDVCRQLKRDPRTANIQVIMLTAMTQSEDVQNALRAGADDYIFKPFSPKQLRDSVLERLGSLFAPGDRVRTLDGLLGTVERQVQLVRSDGTTTGAYQVRRDGGGPMTVEGAKLTLA